MKENKINQQGVEYIELEKPKVLKEGENIYIDIIKNHKLFYILLCVLLITSIVAYVQDDKVIMMMNIIALILTSGSLMITSELHRRLKKSINELSENLKDR